ncbi:MAG: gephyrin-like molybdotransferase Glp [Arachnia sp.]
MLERLTLEPEEYRDELLALVEPVASAQDIAVRDSAGRVLAADVVAAGDVPAFRNSAMDGFAARLADATSGARLSIVGEVPAGSQADPAVRAGQCVAITTGAPVPSDADAIIPVEQVSREAGHILILAAAEPGRHIRGAGEDFAAGAKVLAAGTTMTARSIGLAAAAGVGNVSVVRRPRVGIVATGAELRSPGEPLGRGEIYESNAAFLRAAVEAAGAEPVLAPVAPDDPAALASILDELGPQVDLVFLSGGISVGDYDVVRLTLAGIPDAPGPVSPRRGGESTPAIPGQFRFVRMQPGKPQGWARWPDGTVLVAFPGNPLSTMVSFELFGRPLLDRMLGRRSQGWGRAVAGQGWTTPPGRRQYLPVVAATDDDARVVVLPAHQRGSASHMVSSAALATGLVAVPAEVTSVAPGDIVEYRRFQ